MSEIVEFRSPGEPHGQPNRGPDDGWLAMCADWRAARAQQELNWAEHDKATLFDRLVSDGHELALSPLGKMYSIQSALSIVDLNTVALAIELLRICTTILAHEDPDGTLAEGPVLQIVRNVMRSLERLPGETPLSAPDKESAPAE